MKTESSGKKCLIRVYIVTAAMSTMLFVATLAIMIQLKISLDNPPAPSTAPPTAETNVTSTPDPQTSRLEDKITELKQELELLRQENRNQTNSTTELKEQINKEISTVKTELELMRKENEERLLCGLGVSFGGSVSKDQMRANSYYVGNEAYNGRLNQNKGGCWAALASQVGEWIQVNFLNMTKIRGVMTQGRNNLQNQWVTSYKISCARNETSPDFFKDSSGNDKIFKGNSDRNTIVTHIFPSHKICRFVRIYPQTYNGHMSLRMEWITDCMS